MGFFYSCVIFGWMGRLLISLCWGEMDGLCGAKTHVIFPCVPRPPTTTAVCIHCLRSGPRRSHRPSSRRRLLTSRIFASRPNTRASAPSRMAQVFIKSTSAVSSGGDAGGASPAPKKGSHPASWRMRRTRSESLTFIWQPCVTMCTRRCGRRVCNDGSDPSSLPNDGAVVDSVESAALAPAPPPPSAASHARRAHLQWFHPIAILPIIFVISRLTFSAAGEAVTRANTSRSRS